MRRARLIAGVLLAAGGTVAFADAAVTVAWQEPVGAIRASAEQHTLDAQLATLRTRFLSTARAARGQEAAASSARSLRLARARSARRLDEGTAEGSALGRLRIARLGLSLVFVQGTAGASLAKAPGHYAGTVLPGQRGTVGLAGHRTTHGAPFRHIDRLRTGDRIRLAMPYGEYEYVVQRSQIVSPDRAEVLRTAHSDQLVLTACHPVWSARQRIVVTARLVRWPGALRTAPALSPAPSLALPEAPALSAAPQRSA